MHYDYQFGSTSLVKQIGKILILNFNDDQINTRYINTT